MYFGANIDFDRFILDCIKSIKNVPNYIYGKQLFIELYETTYGIFDHLNANNPLAPVQFNEAENFLKDYLYDGYLRTFLYKEIGKKLNMSFDEFLQHPRAEIENFINIINEVDKKRTQANEEFLSEIKKNNLDPTDNNY